jgi:hypothetical protein
MTADCVHLRGSAIEGSIAIAGDPASPPTLLLATDGRHGTTRVERIAETGATSLVVTIPDSLPLAFDPSGTHLLYLVGHKPPTLTEATITNGHLVAGPWRNPDLQLGALAW